MMHTITPKICTLAEATRCANAAHAEGLIVGFTNGCFDLFHEGHASTLTAAAKQCGVLFVGVNSDASVRRLKGLSRPKVIASQRAEAVARFADFVTVFEEDTAEKLVKALRPTVIFKGQEYAGRIWPEADVADEWGGRAVLLPMVAGVSTTALAARS